MLLSRCLFIKCCALLRKVNAPSENSTVTVVHDLGPWKLALKLAAVGLALVANNFY